MTGQKTYKEIGADKKRGKKRYIERLVEEKEAEKEIEQFEGNTFPEREDDSEHPTY